MTEPENSTGDPLGSQSGGCTAGVVERLEGEIRSLRNLLNIALAALLMLVASLFIFMLWEARVVNRQTGELLVQIANYKRELEPRIHELQSRLTDYSRTHPNFTPIFVKYFGATNAPSPAGATLPPGPGPATVPGAPASPSRR